MASYRCGDCGHESPPLTRRTAAIRKHLNEHGCDPTKIERIAGATLYKRVCIECGSTFQGRWRQKFCHKICVERHQRRICAVAGVCISCRTRTVVNEARYCAYCTKNRLKYYQTRKKKSMTNREEAKRQKLLAWVRARKPEE